MSIVDEIHEQPHVLDRLLTEERPNIARVAEVIKNRNPKFVLIAARGSSDNAAHYAKYVFGARNRLPVALAAPSLFTMYERPPRMKEGLVLAISQSGRSPDIMAVVEEARRQGALTAALTNDTGSPLAGAAEHVIDLRAGPEKSVAATKTYTASLMAIALLSAALEDVDFAELEAVPNRLREALGEASSAADAAARCRSWESCVVLSRGFNQATAYEIALKLKELSYVVAEAHSSADFQHGPIAMVERGFPVMAVVPEGAVATDLVTRLRAIRDRGAEILILSPLEDARTTGQAALRFPVGLPEWLSPLVAVVPGQLFSLSLAQAKGLDPEKPRGIGKVTLTR